ncbi:S-layer homology domain-containing protein [Bacillus sp. JJ722]|uniref:S-layer homology domain-containing protein n=1 Tax=Bacillus sp. JJ722 TaxID=3122973 RepID=UPI00300048E8
MVGNQLEPDRGGLDKQTEENRTFGGADYMLAKVGGMWDALLGEGRKFWNFANSDFHFPINYTRQYSSGYWPGEYSKNYTWVEGNDMKAVLEGMKSGKSYSVFGDLINELDFTISNGKKKEEMGGDLEITKGDDLELTIRFKSPEKNNNGDAVKVDHVDLIAGDVTGLAKPGTDAYNKATNDSTKVIARFTSEDWTKDADGYYTIKHQLDEVNKDQYFRLRGTNLETDVAGETRNGEPLVDPKTYIEDNEARFEAINERNYNDLWFYSNPIFVSVKDKVHFSDMKDHWANESVNRLVELNAIDGYTDGTFRPEEKITRAQFAKFTANSLALKATGDTKRFADYKSIPSWANDSVAAVVEAGLFNGSKENGKLIFKPNTVLTRAEMAVIASRVLNLDVKAFANKDFKDAASIPDWAEEAINAVVDKGIMLGYGDQTFRPSQTVTRAENAVVLDRLLQAMK